MTIIKKSIVINLPLEEVFQHASDYTKWEDWFEGVADFKPVTESTRGNGTRYAYKANMMGMNMGIESEIYNFKENKGWKARSTKGIANKTFWSFEPVNEGTRMTYGLEYSLPIPLIGNWFDTTFMKPQWNKIIESSLENFKYLMENPG